MKKQKIYLDTSVVSHLDAPDTPEKMADTLRLWDFIKAGKYDVVLSSVMFDELMKCPEPKRSLLVQYVGEIVYQQISVTDDILALADKMIDFGVLRQKSLDDCRHIAAALITQCDLILSWNFKHIVNPNTIKGVKVIATLEGYKDVLICTPTMLVEGDAEDE